MDAFLNFGEAFTCYIKNTKTIEDKLKLINYVTSQYMCECNEIC